MRTKKEILTTIEEAKISINKIDDLIYFNDDKDIAQALLNRSGSYLEYLNDTLKDDDDIVMKAIKSDGRSIRYASKRLQNNKNIIKNAILNTLNAINHLEPNILIKFDKSEIIEFIKKDPKIYKELPLCYISDLEIVKLALSLQINLYQYLPENIKNNEDIFNMVNDIDSNIAIKYTSNTLLNDLGEINIKILRTKTIVIEEECEVSIPATVFEEYKSDDIAEMFFDDDNCLTISEDELSVECKII